METICKEMPYIDESFSNLLEINKEDLKKAIETIEKVDVIILVGEGRSYEALKIGFRGLNKRIITLEEPDFRWSNLYEAAPHLEKQYKQIVLIVNTSSGETPTPRQRVKDLVDYIEETKSKKFRIIAFGSRPDSSVGEKIRDKEYGLFVELKGPKSQAERAEEALDFGIMNDVYELLSTLLFYKMRKKINYGWKFEEFLSSVKEEAKGIGILVNNWIKSEKYRILIQQMTSRGKITVAGLGPSRDVALMTGIRLNHIKRAFGEEANITGPFAQRPRLGDVLIVISHSGETESVLEWVEDFKNAGAFVFAFCSRESSLTRKVEHSFLVPKKTEDFYPKIVYLTSVIAVGLVGEFKKKGFSIRPDILKWWHSVTE